jgi:gluconokinase
MGVAGSGKSTIGKLLSQHTDWTFYDGDDFHPPANLDKMSRGIPLNEEDRQPWLLALQNLIDNLISQGKNAIIACSALKADYRKLIQGNHQNLVWVYLHGDYQQIYSRIKQRQGHFFSAAMLRSQFADLEEPETALKLDISENPKAIVEEILTYLGSLDNFVLGKN